MAETPKNRHEIGSIKQLSAKEVEWDKICEWFYDLSNEMQEKIADVATQNKKLNPLEVEGDLNIELLLRYLHALSEAGKLDEVFGPLYDERFKSQHAIEKIIEKPPAKNIVEDNFKKARSVKKADSQTAIDTLVLNLLSLQEAAEHYGLSFANLLQTLIDNPENIATQNLQEFINALKALYKAIAEAEKALEKTIKPPIPSATVVDLCVETEHNDKTGDDLAHATARDVARIAVGATHKDFHGITAREGTFQHDAAIAKARAKNIVEIVTNVMRFRFQEAFGEKSGARILSGFPFLQVIHVNSEYKELETRLKDVHTETIVKLIGMLRNERDKINEADRAKMGKFVGNLERIVEKRIEKELLKADSKERHEKAAGIVYQELHSPLDDVASEPEEVKKELEKYAIPKQEGEAPKPRGQGLYEAVRKIIGFIADLASLVTGHPFGGEKGKKD